MRYFKNVETLEALKKAYKMACLKLHPDKGGDAGEFKAMQAEYEKLAKILAYQEQGQARHKKADGTAKSAQEIFEEQTQFAEVLGKLIHLEGLQLEICGGWLWVSGNTWQWHTQIKEAGCKFASRKKAWYWYAGQWFKKVRKPFTMDEIRDLHGSEILKSSVTPLLAQ